MKRPKSMSTLILGAIGLVTAIGGAAWTLGEPPYANRPWVEDRFVEVDLRSYERERDAVGDRIADYRIKRASAPPQVKNIIDGELEKLQNRLNSLNQTIYQLRQRGAR